MRSRALREFITIVVNEKLDEVIEPFEPALVSQLRKVNSELESSAYDFDDATAEIRAAHTAISALLKKLQRAPTSSFGKRKSGTFVRSPEAPVAVEGKSRATRSDTRR